MFERKKRRGRRTKPFGAGMGRKVPGDSKKSVGHGMGGLFGVTPKKPEPDNPPPTRAFARGQKAKRMKRLEGKFI